MKPADRVEFFRQLRDINMKSGSRLTGTVESWKREDISKWPDACCGGEIDRRGYCELVIVRR